MDNKVYIVTYDATNEYSYPEDDHGFSDTFGVFSNIDEAHKKVCEFIDELKSLVSSKGFAYSIVNKSIAYENICDKGCDTFIEFNIIGAGDCDISGFIFYIREAELNHAELTIENIHGLNWLKNKEDK